MDIEERKQSAVEMISDDESLTDELTDDEAIVLNDWAFAKAEERAEKSLDLPRGFVYSALDDRISKLKVVMRGINKLVAKNNEGCLDNIELIKGILDIIDELE